MTAPRPPRLAVWCLRRLVPPDRHADVVGDVVEEYGRWILPERGRAGARRWLWGQVARSVRPAIAMRIAARRGDRRAADGRTRGRASTASMATASLAADLRDGTRTLARSPAFAVMAVAVLGVAVGASTTIYSVVDGVLLRDLPYPDADRLVAIGTTSPARHDRALTEDDQRYALMGSAVGNVLDWRARATTIASITAVEWRRLVVPGSDGAEDVGAAAVTRRFFETLGVTPAAGRLFLDEEYRVGGAPVAMLGHGAWRRRVGGDPEVIGRAMATTGGAYEIVGVLPDGFRPPERLRLAAVDLWLPLHEDDPAYADRGSRSVAVMGKLAPGRSLGEARAELWALAAGLAGEHPEGNVFPDGSRFGAGANDLRADTVGDVGRVLVPLLGAVAFLLAIACANVAHLSLARGLERAGEFAVRAAVGASRARLIGLLLAESAVIGLLAGGVGVVVACGGVDAFTRLAPSTLPRMTEVAVNARVLGVALATALGASLLFGIVPALDLSRRDPNAGLRAGAGTMTGTRAHHRYRAALVVFETALSLVLAVAAALLFNSFLRLQLIDPGFRADHVLTFAVEAPGGFEAPDEARAFWPRLLDELERLPGVEALGGASSLPMQDTNWRPGVWFDGDVDTLMRGVDAYIVSPGYLDALRIPVVSGRVPGPGDRPGTRRVVAVNRAFVDSYLDGGPALGRRFRMSWDEGRAEVEIVGVLADARLVGPALSPVPQIYASAGQIGWPLVNVALRVRPDVAVSEAAIRRAVGAVDPSVPVRRLAPLDARLSGAVATPRFGSALAGLFAAIAVLLAASGVYGTVRLAVGQRTREVGIRLALGARASDVRRFMIRLGMLPTAIGLAVGLAGAYLTAGLLDGFLFGVGSRDVVTFAGVVAGVAGVAWLAAALPARRVSRVDVLATLRRD